MKRKKKFTTAKPVNKRLVVARRKWLKENDLTVKQFSKAVVLDYNTVVRYFDLGRTPAPLYLERIQVVYKDFPV